MPYVNVYVDLDAILDEIDSEDIANILRRRGYEVFQSESSLDRVTHFAQLGLMEDARKEALIYVGEQIGVTL